jgi:hypothetical protein
MTEFLKEIFKDRVTHPLYKTYAVSWFIVNWKVIYSLFFVSEDYIFEKYGLLRNEYFFDLFFSISGYYFWIFVILFPVIITWLMIWVFPDLIFIKATKRNERFRVDKTIARIDAEKRIEEGKSDLILAKKENIKEQIEVEKIKKANKPEIKWEKEFMIFKAATIYLDFQDIIDSIYTKSGLTKENWIGGNVYGFKVNKEILAYSHANNLIEIIPNENDVNRIELTDKGKYFVLRYSQEKTV